MTAIDQKLHPGEYFIERRDKSGKWEFLTRDNDGDVMKIRYDFWAELLRPGEAVRLFSPARQIISEKEFDMVPDVK